MNFSTEEKANLLLKKILNKPSILNERPFQQEPNRPSQPAVITSQIWSKDVPGVAPPELSSLIETDLDDFGNVLKGSYAGKTSTDGFFKRYIKIPLVLAPGSNNQAYEALQNADKSHPFGYADGISATNYGQTGTFKQITTRMIPFNHDPLGSYNVNLYRNTGVELPFGVGEWIPDKDTGIITFYDYTQVASDINALNLPLFSFYRYIGPTGFNPTFIASGDNFISPDLCPQDMQPNSISDGVYFGKNTCEGSWRILMVAPFTVSNNKSSRIETQQYNGSAWITKFRMTGS